MRTSLDRFDISPCRRNPRLCFDFPHNPLQRQSSGKYCVLVPKAIQKGGGGEGGGHRKGSQPTE